MAHTERPDHFADGGSSWDRSKTKQLKIIPRRPLDDDNPDGYLESDKDFVLNNINTCLAFLER